MSSLAEIDSPAKAKTVLSAIQVVLARCRPSWNDSWSVSFFAEKKYAGYKTDPEIEPYVRDGTWSHSYIGEYDTGSRKLALEPMDPKRVKFLTIVLSHPNVTPAKEK